MKTRGLLLAGGQARRMGGGDKPLLAIGGRTILSRVIERLAPQLPGGRDAMALSANGPAERFAAAGLPVLPDPAGLAGPDELAASGGDPRLGPLAGVLAGLDWAGAEGGTHVVCVAGDTPFFPPDLAARLAEALAPSAARPEPSPIAVAAIRDAGGRLRPQPTFALWPVALAGALRAALRGGTRKILAFADDHGWTAAEFPSPQADGAVYDPFWNVNTPEDLAAAEGAARFWDAQA